MIKTDGLFSLSEGFEALSVIAFTAGSPYLGNRKLRAGKMNLKLFLGGAK